MRPHPLTIVLFLLTADNFVEVAADWWYAAEANRQPDEHGQFLAEVRSKWKKRGECRWLPHPHGRSASTEE